jgi:hypothetical protein
MGGFCRLEMLVLEKRDGKQAGEEQDVEKGRFSATKAEYGRKALDEDAMLGRPFHALIHTHTHTLSNL